MAARATRSASGAASSDDDALRCLLLALSHDELGVIVDGLADPLRPVVAVALSSTCLGLRTPLQAALEVLRQWHEKAEALCFEARFFFAGPPIGCCMTCADLRDAHELDWRFKGLTTEDMGTLGMILRTNGLPMLRRLRLDGNGFGHAGMQALLEGLVPGSLPAIVMLCLDDNNFGPTGAEALAAALSRGTMRTLKQLDCSFNYIGDEGMAALAAPLRKMPALKELLVDCGGPEGVASLVAGLGKDDFKALTKLSIRFGSNSSGKAYAMLTSALDQAAMPKLKQLLVPIRPSGAHVLFQAASRRGIEVSPAALRIHEI